MAEGCRLSPTFSNMKEDRKITFQLPRLFCKIKKRKVGYDDFSSTKNFVHIPLEKNNLTTFSTML